jgi:ribosomal protein S18 acetylase RimI-like enzyme
VITYRTFRNWDPPTLVALWNASVASRGAARTIEVQDLDRLVFSKPYFDPKGIILAEEDERAIGFVHAGFGASDDEGQLSRNFGVIAMLVVRPEQRRRGIARELVRRAEAYLRAGGSTVIYAGSMHPLDPFYLGLYGGSELPGILKSDTAANQLFQSLGYKAVDECLVLQRNLSAPLVITDPKAKAWSRQVAFEVVPQAAPPDWWTACRYAALEFSDFVVRIKSTGRVAARARGWEMYPVQKSWGAEAVGIVDVSVEQEFRQQGVGTFLMVQILRHYRENGLKLAEVQTMARNTVACRLFQRIGFREIDRGIIYRAEGDPWAAREEGGLRMEDGG